MKRLDECRKSPNCVSTTTRYPEKLMEPIPFECDIRKVRDVTKAVVGSKSGVTLVEDEEQYLRFEFKSRFFGFVDDVEFLIDPAQKEVHFRSASRKGHSDFGVNRRRMSKISKLIEAELENQP